MTRVTIALVLLAVGLALPVGVLVVRALESAAVEEENRHRLIAERAFDELEAALSRFLAEEEARPFDAYRFYATAPTDGSEARPRLSPLAAGPRQPFVLGYFQIDPDGSLHSPQLPRNVERAVARGDFTPEASVMRLPVLLQQAWSHASAPRMGAADGPKDADDLLEEMKTEADRGAAGAKADSYEIYRSFNLAAKRRAERQKKVTRVPGLALRSPVPAAESVRIALDPMVGRSVPGDRLLLVRTVVAGEQAYRQGLLLDRRALGRWLDAQVIAASALGRAGARANFVAATSPTGDASGRAAALAYRYRHAFAEPFDAMAVVLALPELPGGRGTGTIHALAALLAAVAAAGLFAVYRMVAVVVEFAERRNRFVAAVSHELKTPLTSIRMYAEMLRDGWVASEEKRDEYYHTITDESERLSRLIDNVLDFSRLERGEYEVNAQCGDVVPLLYEVVEKLRPHVERQGFTIPLSVCGRPPEVWFDRDALTQVIFNLVDNALKYAREAARKEILVSCGGDETGVRIAVRDFGAGIGAGELERVFEAFYRGQEEPVRSASGPLARGTGIGLALVKELTESIGGRVRAENAEGGGLRVVVRLPAGPGPTPSPPS